MKTERKDRATTDLQDTKADVKVVLSGLWIAMLFMFAHVDIFGFWRTDVINGALVGEVPGAGCAINQTFPLLTTMSVPLNPARRLLHLPLLHLAREQRAPIMRQP